MPGHRKYPLRIIVDGNPIQVRSVGDTLFQSKSKYYRAHYDLSGQLIGEIIGSYQQLDKVKQTNIC